MKRILYFECNMGAAGDMLMGALADLLPDRKAFADRMNGLGIPDVQVEFCTDVKCGITGTHANVTVKGKEEESLEVPVNGAACHSHPHSHPHTHLHEHEEHIHADGHKHSHEHHGLTETEAIIQQLKVPDHVKEDVRKIYRILAEAESRVHGRPVSEIHFHEVGTMDALADITGCALLIRELNPDIIVTSPIHVGYGQVRCAHGVLPVPAPATAKILEGMPCYAGNVEGELCTPTGAAILKYYSSRFGYLPKMVIQSSGYGMGKKDFPIANCVRAILGETEEYK